MQGWVGGALAPPYEGLDGGAHCMGLLDGPAALVLALHVQAGSVAMQQAGAVGDASAAPTVPVMKKKMM